jgi:hypothetical protein
MTTGQTADKTGFNRSTVRYYVRKAGSPILPGWVHRAVPHQGEGTGQAAEARAEFQADRGQLRLLRDHGGEGAAALRPGWWRNGQPTKLRYGRSLPTFCGRMKADVDDK